VEKKEKVKIFTGKKVLEENFRKHSLTRKKNRKKKKLGGEKKMSKG